MIYFNYYLLMSGDYMTIIDNLINLTQNSFPVELEKSGDFSTQFNGRSYNQDKADSSSSIEQKLKNVLQTLENLDVRELKKDDSLKLQDLQGLIKQVIPEETDQKKNILTRIYYLKESIEANHDFSGEKTFSVEGATPSVLHNLQDPLLDTLSNDYQKAYQQSFYPLAEEYKKSSILNPYTSDASGLYGESFIKHVYQKLRADVESFVGHEEIMQTSREKNGGSISTRRLEELAQWIEQKEGAHLINFSFALVKDKETKFEKFLNGLNSNYLEEGSKGILEQANTIRAWMKENSKEFSGKPYHQLSLGDLGLSRIPKEIQYFTGVLSLELHNNSLTMLPVELEMCTKLRKIGLENNRFTIFPGHLKLESLQTLHLENNPLMELPDELFVGENYKKLRQLHIADTGITRKQLEYIESIKPYELELF